MTNDGKQMSNNWILGSNRLVNADGPTIAENIISNGFTSLLAEVAPNGSTTFKQLDQSANIIGDFNP